MEDTDTALALVKIRRMLMSMPYSGVVNIPPATLDLESLHDWLRGLQSVLLRHDAEYEATCKELQSLKKDLEAVRRVLGSV